MRINMSMRASASTPKGMVAALPARSVGRKQRAGFKQSAQTRSGSRTNGGHAMLVVMAHSISDSQKQSADGAANAKQWLMHMRTKVASLDGEIKSAKAQLSNTEAARAQEREQLAALQVQMSSLQSQWVSDQKALQQTIEQTVNVEESDASVREVQGQAVQLGSRVSKLQTLLQNQDETLAELRGKLAAKKPQLAAVGAGSTTLDGDIMASFRSNTSPQALSAVGGFGASWDMGPSLGDLAAATSVGAKHAMTNRSTDVLRTPKALGVTFFAATFAAANAASGIWGTVRRVAPKNMRGPLDFAASAAATTLVGAALTLLG